MKAFQPKPEKPTNFIFGHRNQFTFFSFVNCLANPKISIKLHLNTCSFPVFSYFCALFFSREKFTFYSSKKYFLIWRARLSYSNVACNLAVLGGLNMKKARSGSVFFKFQMKSERVRGRKENCFHIENHQCSVTCAMCANVVNKSKPLSTIISNKYLCM